MEPSQQVPLVRLPKPATRILRLSSLLLAPQGKLRAALWEPGFVQRPAPAWELLGEPPLPGTAGPQVLDVETYLPGDLLVKADLASMACSLELRSPFLDNEFVQTVFRAPASALTSNSTSLRLITDGNAALGRIPTDRGLTAAGGAFERGS